MVNLVWNQKLPFVKIGRFNLSQTGWRSCPATRNAPGEILMLENLDFTLPKKKRILVCQSPSSGDVYINKSPTVIANTLP
jgi:hypothetical protein